MKEIQEAGIAVLALLAGLVGCIGSVLVISFSVIACIRIIAAFYSWIGGVL